MSSPTPEERDPQLVSALEQAVRCHSKKHYQAGLSAGIGLAIKEILAGFSLAENKKHSEMILRLAALQSDALAKSLDQKPTPR
jgi:hypothetical protein